MRTRQGLTVWSKSSISHNIEKKIEPGVSNCHHFSYLQVLLGNFFAQTLLFWCCHVGLLQLRRLLSPPRPCGGVTNCALAGDSGPEIRPQRVNALCNSRDTGCMIEQRIVFFPMLSPNVCFHATSHRQKKKCEEYTRKWKLTEHKKVVVDVTKTSKENPGTFKKRWFEMIVVQYTYLDVDASKDSSCDAYIAS